MMLTLARLSIRRPKVALAVWLTVAAVLVALGANVAGSLSPPITVVPGTQSSRAQQLAGAQFGPTQLIPILLEGPARQLDRDGPALVRRLAARPFTRVLSAWDAGSESASLRPTPTAAMIVVSVDRSEVDTDRYDLPQIERATHEQVRAPVRSYISGQPTIDVAERNASMADLRRVEAIAAGIVFLLLLIGLRAPVAAALVTIVGGVSMLAGFGAVALLGRAIAVDPVTVAAGTMTGLALSVAFALLILDRFHHEEYPGVGGPRDAASAAMLELAGTGRAVLVAGTALIVALVLAAVVGPTQLIQSVGIGAVAGAAFGTGGAVVVMPAALVLLGRRIDVLRRPAPALATRVWSRLLSGGNWVTRHAVGAGAVATLVLALVAVPAFALKSGPESITALPAGSPARIAFDEINRVMGAGYATPYNLIVVADGRPITTPAVLAGLSSFQRTIAQDPTVSSVTGPGSIDSTATALSSFGPQLDHSAAVSDASKKQLLTLIAGLGEAGAGSAQLRSGLRTASTGAGELHTGSGAAQSGAAQLHTGLGTARDGSAQLTAGMTTALTAADELEAGAGEALTGARRLEHGISLAQGPATQSVPALAALSRDTSSTAGDIATALARVQAMTAGRSDPAYAGVLSALQAAGTEAAGTTALARTIAAQAPALVTGLGELHSGAAQLVAGIEQLRDGDRRLATGMSKLDSGGRRLKSGLNRLTTGAAALESGLAQLTTGAGALASGLSSGVAPAGQLTTGLGTMQAAVVKARGQIPSTAALEQLRRQSPGLFSSGYFVLAALAGATRDSRNAATFVVNVQRGGTAAQILVVSRYASNDPRTLALGSRLVAAARTYAGRENLQIAVGGPEGSLGELTRMTEARIWIDVAVLALAIASILAVALRAMLLPVIATLFSLLTAAATFGVLQLLFGGVNPPLGGTGYLDPVTLIEIFAAAMSIGAIYSALLLSRRREELLAGADGPAALRRSLRATAPALTGAGVVMIAAILPFLFTALIDVRELGVGIIVAIGLDVLILRPVLLPAAERVLDVRRARSRPRRPGRPSAPDPEPVAAGVA